MGGPGAGGLACACNIPICAPPAPLPRHLRGAASCQAVPGRPPPRMNHPRLLPTPRVGGNPLPRAMTSAGTPPAQGRGPGRTKPRETRVGGREVWPPPPAARGGGRIGGLQRGGRGVHVPGGRCGARGAAGPGGTPCSYRAAPPGAGAGAGAAAGGGAVSARPSPTREAAAAPALKGAGAICSRGLFFPGGRPAPLPPPASSGGGETEAGPSWGEERNPAAPPRPPPSPAKGGLQRRVPRAGAFTCPPGQGPTPMLAGGAVACGTPLLVGPSCCHP